MALTKVTGDFIKAGVITQAHLHSSHGITSSHIAEGDKLFFTNARARGAISVSGNALSYNSSTGVITSNFEESPTFTGSVIIGQTGNEPLKFSKSVYGDFDTENFFRIKLQDQGGIHNDVGIGQTASGSLGFNITSGGSFIFNNGTSGNVFTINGTSGTSTFAGDLTVSGGDIILGGTGRIQGIDTVSAGTDAANKTYVDNQVAGIVDSAPSTLDTLNELAAALGDDANFSTTVTNNIATKMPLAGGTFTGFIQLGANQLRFDQSGTRSWTVSAASGNLNINSGDSLGNVAITSGLTVQDAATFSNNVVINGSGSSGNSLYVTRGSDSTVALRVQNTGEVITQANYFYATGPGVSMYVQNTAVFRGAIMNDSSNADVRIADNLTVEGTVKGDIYYDRNNTGYYLNPESWSYIYGFSNEVRYGGGSYSDPDPGVTRDAKFGNNGIAAVSGKIGPWNLRSYASQTEYFVLDNGSLNGLAFKVRYDGATANRWWDLGFKDGNGTYYEGLKGYNNTTLTWKGNTIWHAGNDGSGSGLDADLLDGIDSASFVRSDADDSLSGQYTFTKTNDHAIKVGTIRGTAVGSQTGEFIQMYNRVNIGGPSGWGASNTATPNYGLSTYGGTRLSVYTDYTESGGSMRAPIFYDSNNTGYYADPASTTNLNTLTVGGVTTINNTLTVGNGFWIQSANGNGKILLSGNLHIDSHNGNDIYINYYAGARRFRVYNGSSAERFRVDTDGITYAFHQLRTPIIYDYNDTSRYLDPNVTSRIDKLEVANTANQDTPSAYLKIGSDGFIFGGNNSGYEVNSAQISAGYHTGNSLNFVGMGTNSSNRRMDFWAEGGFYVSGNIYDKDATSYYADFGGTSRTNSIISNVFSGDISTSGDGQNNYPFRLRYDYNAWMMTVASNTWGLFWAGNSGARYGTNGNGGPGNIWSNSTNPNEFTFVGGDTTLWTVHGTSGNSWQAGYGMAAGSYRAPEFYDSNDTAFYINPNSTSNIYKIQSSSKQAAPRWDTAFYVLQAQHWYGDTSTQEMFIGESGNNINIRGVLDINGGHGGLNITNSSILSSATSTWTGNPGGAGKIQYHSNRWYIVSDSSSNRIVQFRKDGSDKCYIDNDGRLIDVYDVRAYVYYDRDDTGYYANPAGTSNFFKLETKRHAVTGTSVPNYPDVGIEIVTNSNGVPALGFHRGGYSATTLYEYDGELYVNAWTTRAQTGKLVSTGNLQASLFSGSWNGSNFPGSRWNGFAVNGGEIVFQQDNPSTGKMSIMVDGNFYAGENGGFWSIYSGNNYNNKVGIYGDSSGNLQIGTSASENVLRTQYGYVQVGPMNYSHAHIYTDRANFYLNKPIQVLGSSIMNQYDIRSAIFYDVANTGYYIDPASTSFISNLTMNGNIEIRRTDPTIYFRDTDHNSAMLHTNSNIFYILRGGNDTTSWATVNGYWPLEINLTNNQATFGGIVQAITDMRAPVFYDRNNTVYYTDPGGTSKMSVIEVGASGYSNIWLGGQSGNYFRFHTNNSHTYFDGNVGDINWRQGSSTRFIFYMTTANMTVNGTVTQYSDSRLKENIMTIDGALDKVNQLRGVYYNRTDINTSKKQIGLVAQEVESVVPEIVHTADDELNTKSISYAQLNALLVEAIKEQQTIIDDLKSRIETLENQ